MNEWVKNGVKAKELKSASGVRGHMLILTFCGVDATFLRARKVWVRVRLSVLDIIGGHVSY